MSSNKGIFFPGDDPDNSTIITMREQIKKLQEDLNQAKTDLTEARTNVKNMEREKMTEIERLRDENKSFAEALENSKQMAVHLENTTKSIETFTSFVNKQFDTRLNAVPTEQREKLKALAHIEGNPIESLTRLDAAIELAGLNKTDVVTNPHAGNPDPANKPNDKLDMTKINFSTVGVLKPVEVLLQEAKAR